MAKIYTKELAAEICRRIVDGETLKAICESMGLSYRLVSRWEYDNVAGFAQEIADARRMRVTDLIDEIVTIADECPVHDAAIKRAALQINTRRFLIDRLLPKIPNKPIETEQNEELAVEKTPAEMMAEFRSANLRIVKQ